MSNVGKSATIYRKEFDPNKDCCPYCGNSMRYSDWTHCEHVLSISFGTEIAYASPDFVKVADQLYGIPDIVLVNEELNGDGNYFENRREIPTKKFGCLSPGAIEAGVLEALEQKGVRLTVADTDEYEPARIIFIEDELSEEEFFSYTPIEGVARNLLASVYLDDPDNWEIDDDLPRYDEFLKTAFELYKEIRKYSNPVEAMLFYVNGKKRLCQRYKQPHYHTLKDFALFEEKAFRANYTSGYTIHRFDDGKWYLPNADDVAEGIPEELLTIIAILIKDCEVTAKDAIHYCFLVAEQVKHNENIRLLVEVGSPETVSTCLKKAVDDAVYTLMVEDYDLSFKFLASEANTRELKNALHWILHCKVSESDLVKACQTKR